MSSTSTTMKAVHYEKPFQVSVREVPLPKIEHPDDAIIKVTTAAICGSDLHMYQGRTAAEAGLIFGHENMGIVSEVGSGVTLLKKGDRVVLPFNVADGRCLNCEEGNTAFCTGVNPGFAGGAYGYVAMGPYAGGQAQYLRIPFADFNALPLPPGTAHEASFALLADIFPTGWHGLTLSNFKPGEAVAVFGAGPVGLMAAYSAFLRGASRIFVIDKVPERLDVAKKIPGCTSVDFSGGEDAVDVIIRENDGKMVDRSIDAVGYQAVGSGKEAGEVPNMVLEQCIKVTRPTGGIGVPGLYVPSDPGAVDEKSSIGMMSMSFGKLFEKGLTIGTGQCNVKKYNRYLRDMIISGRANPSFVVSHEIGIDEAPTAYEKFDKRVEGYTKVLIHPNGPLSSSMELSDPETPDTSVDMTSSTSRRKSGRATRKPVLLNKDPNISQVNLANSGKRKRVDVPVEDMLNSSDSESEDDAGDDESDPDEEELKERRRKASRPKKAPSKSVAKKPRTGPSMTTSLAVRPAINGVKKAAKPKQPRARPIKNTEDSGTGLYSEIFAEGHTLDAVAANWIARWEQNNAEAMSDMINLVIKCTGCNSQVDVHDIEDQDNAPSKLGDIQEEYQALKPTDYPLISRAKGNATFRSTMSGFFATLISTCHAAGLLYSDLAILENIEVWVHTMSSSTLRPFRHTATVIALTIGNTLCTVAADIAENTAKTMRQKEGEQKKKSVNKERIKALEAKIAEGDRRRTQVLDSMKDLLDAVFIHRYRDVDPKIRLECVTALGNWITTLPDVYFDGMHLRYLGWVLSDVSAPTRAEVIKQLGKLFKNKDNTPRLRTFTEKFRARIVEMAVRDSEVSVRAATVELLDMIRRTGLLEPDDIDIVGGLIFDIEPRVRKAVAGFFAENINDLYESTVEDLGGEDDLAEILGEEVEGEFDAPRSSWLKLKCVAEALESYDVEDDEQGPALRAASSGGGLIATGMDSRYAMAARTIYEGILITREWEVLAGYLLFDFSSTDQPSEGTDATLESRCKLNEKETVLLLEILNVAVSARLSDAVEAETDKRGHKMKVQKEESREVRESTALHLAKRLPQLLKKFGSTPSTASTVLRLGQVLDLEIFQELRQDSTSYASLLDDINKQFLTHTDQSVLAEASTAILHAREYEDLEEVTESKVQELWDDTISTLRALRNSREDDNIPELCNTVRRMASLASISDCVAALDLEGRSTSKKKASSQSTASPLSLLMELIRDPELDNAAGEEASETLISVVKAILFYYMWTARSLQSAVPSGAVIPRLPDFALFAQGLETLCDNWPAVSPVRLAAVGTILDLYTLFATFRHVQIPPNHPNDDELRLLVQHIPHSSESLILSTYVALEKSFAKKSHRTLEAAPDDNLASDPEDSSDDEDEEEPSQAQQETLIAEKRLCEIAGKMVLAIVGRVLDHEGPNKGKIRERLKLNKLKMGSNFKEVVTYLDGPKPKGKKRAPAKKSGKNAAKPVEIEDENEESEEDRQVEEGGEEDLRERELVEDRIVDADEESAGGEEPAGVGADDVEDDIMGD